MASPITPHGIEYCDRTRYTAIEMYRFDRVMIFKPNFNGVQQQFILYFVATLLAKM